MDDQEDGLGAIRGAIFAIALLLIAALAFFILSLLLFTPDREDPPSRAVGPKPYSWRVPPAR